MFFFRKFLFFYLIFSCLFTPLTVFGICEYSFSKLDHKIFHKAGIYTIRDLMSKTPEELMALPGFGGEDVLRIRKALFRFQRMGLSLADTSDLSKVNSLFISPSSINALHKAGIYTIRDLISKTPEELMTLPGFGGEGVLQLRINLFYRELSLADTSDLSKVNSLLISPSSINALHKAGIYTVRDLISKTPKELMALPGFGGGDVLQLRIALFRMGLSLADTSDLSKVNSLFISPSSINALHKAGIYTIRDLISKTTKELMALPVFERKTLSLVGEAIIERGFHIAAFDIGLVNSVVVSPRASSALYEAGIHTIKDLMSKTPEELMALPGFRGEDVLRLRLKLSHKGKSLAGTSDLSKVNSLFISPSSINALHKAGIHTIKDLTSKTMEELMALPGFLGVDVLQLRINLFYRELSLADTSDLSKVNSLPISPRSINALHKAGIYTMKDSTSKTPEELMALPDFGGGDLLYLRSALSQRGLSLAGTSDLSKVNSLLTSPSSINALHKAGIYTIRDLMSKTTKELHALPGFGKKARLWVQEALSERGFDIAAFDLRSSALVVSPRISSALYEAGIHTIKDLTSKTPEELMALPNFGREDFLQLREVLSQRRKRRNIFETWRMIF